MSRSPRRWILSALVVGLSVPVVVLLGLPWPWVLRWVDPPATSFMLYREREAARQGRELRIVWEWVDLEDIPESVVRAVLVSEDDRFRQHHGIDWKALADEVHWSGGDDFSWWSAADRAALWRAIGYYRAHRSEIKGRSTITQQLAKNLYFTPERSLVRKAEELVVARRLERFLSKDRILELYLNTAELGPGIFGVGAAAREYFGVPVQDLGRVEAASLAATLPQPLTSNPAHRPGRMAWRRDLILDRLAGRDVTIPDEPPPVELPPPSLDVGVSLDSVPALLPDSASHPDTGAHADTVSPADTVSHPDTASRPDTVPPDTTSAGGAPDKVPAPGVR